MTKFQFGTYLYYLKHYDAAVCFYSVHIDLLSLFWYT